MSKGQKELWTGLNESARKILSNRNYKEGEFARRLSGSGMDAGELATIDRRKPEIEKLWIPGVEILCR